MTFDAVKVTKLSAIARVLLEREIVLPSLVTLNGYGDFKGALNDTITIRVPARAAYRSRALRPATENDRTILLDDLTENTINVTIDEDLYSAVGIEDEVARFDISDYAAQILAPQVRAVAKGFEDKLAELITDAPYVTTVDFDITKPYQSVVDARTELGRAQVPLDGRTLLVGAGIEAEILKSDQFIKADSSGDGIASTALREASVGRIAGSNIVVSYAIPENEAYLFHKTAFAAVWAAPIVPRGASFGQSVSGGGTGASFTWLQDYDALQSRDRSIVHVYAGANYLTDPADTRGDTEVIRTGGLIRAVKLVAEGLGS